MIELSGVYAILNLINDKFYVGSSKNIYSRWHSHRSSLRGNYHDNSYLQNAWNKYGESNFIVVVLELASQSELEYKEQWWIDNLNCCDKSIGYNARTNATNNFGFKHSEEGKRNIAKSKLGTKASVEAKRNMSKAAALRNKDKWPHSWGVKCPCDDCKQKHKLRNLLHSRKWRSENRDHYNEYARDYRAKT
jgi:group I intron endonuclease